MASLHEILLSINIDTNFALDFVKSNGESTIIILKQKSDKLSITFFSFIQM